MTSRERADQVLIICLHEMRQVSSIDRETIRDCVQAEIEEAVRGALSVLNKSAPKKIPEPYRKPPQDLMKFKKHNRR